MPGAEDEDTRHRREEAERKARRKVGLFCLVWFHRIGGLFVPDSDQIRILDRIPPYDMNISILTNILF